MIQSRIWNTPIVSFAVLLVAVVTTLFFWDYAKNTLDMKTEQRFREQVDQIKHQIEQRVEAQKNVLYGARAFLSSSKNVRNDEWRYYAKNVGLESRYPGILALRYIQYVRDKQLRDFLTNVRRDSSFKDLGYPDFVTHADAKSEDYGIVLFLEPLAGNQWMFGVDTFSDPRLKQVLEEALDKDQSVASGVLNVSQGRKKSSTGFLMALPVFRGDATPETAADKKKALLGFVDVVLKSEYLFSGLDPASELSRFVTFEVYDGEEITNTNRLYGSEESTDLKNVTPRCVASAKMNVGGREWVLYFSTRPGFKLDPIQENFPTFVLVGGLVLSLLLFAVFYALSLSRAQAIALAEGMTRDLKEALRVKTEFTSTVSHELRTPLAAIKESVSMLEDQTVGPVNTEQKEMIETAARNVDRLTRLINAVLDYQGLELNKISFHKRYEELNALVEETVKTFLSVARKKNVSLEFLPDKNVKTLKLDRDRIIQVIANLLDNSLKFSEHGSIRVRTQSLENCARVSVQDEGPGIDAKDLGKLFVHFSQLRTQGARKTGGTGLGLAISKKIVESHGGQIGVESIHGKGTTFYFDLPLPKPEAAHTSAR